MDSATKTVFATAELLEQILLGLPIRSLARSKTTSKRWSDTIAASPKLRDRLAFREPTPYTLNKWWMRTYTINPRLVGMKTKRSKIMAVHHPYLDEVEYEIAIDHQAVLDLPTAPLQELISQPPETQAYVTLAWMEGEDPCEVCSTPLLANDGITFAVLRQSILADMEEKQRWYPQKTLNLADFCVGFYETPDTDKSRALSLKKNYGNLP
ncbi:hypothetical protein HII31_01021 [Pseudocercospora fuligena]|uniref:F-box domain-containing protein n=1 Tax=Pseudocercospora fuligena TaxID=685502 RepID=A0A8H6VPD9_9PEZI|nr:hypothetical protein HII31_01021 [Pseudocercospora fuligena]